MSKNADQGTSSNAETKKERKPQTKKAAFRLETWFLDELLERAGEERLRLVEQFNQQSDPSPTRHESRTEDRFSEKTLPSREHFKEIVQTSFWASLRKEEGKFANFAVAYEEKANDPWTIVFAEPKPFDVENLAKLTPAVGNLKAAAKIYPNATGALEIWGTSNYVAAPLTVKVIDPGQIIVSYFIKNIAVISGEEAVFIESSLHDRSDVIWSGLGLGDSDRYFSPYIDLRVMTTLNSLRTMRTLGRGGTLIILPEGEKWQESITSKHVSPKSTEELGGMGLDEIISYLESWQPSGGQEGHSLLGLESSLRAAILNEPELFSGGAERFKHLRPEYARALISGLNAAIDQGRPVEWGPVLGFCMFVATEPVSIPAEGVAPAERDRLLAQVKNEVASLIRKGMRDDGSGIPDELIDKVSELLPALINNLPPVGTEQLASKRRSIAESVISARAYTLEDIIRYSVWVRNRRRGADNETSAREGEGGLGELREILERNLEPDVDPDLRLRKIYGENIPSLVYLDREWVARNLSIIFPAAEDEHQLFDAAWRAYILYGVYYIPAFDLLQEQYGVAIERLGREPVVEAYGTDPDRQLAQHIMVYYARGRSKLDDEQSLIYRFFMAASSGLRASAIGFVGDDLRRTEGNIDPEILNRLEALWSSRFDMARRTFSTDDHKEEIAAFGLWFASGKFDEEWSLRQLQESLLLVKKVDGDDFVVERLAVLASKYPRIAVECLGLMIEGDEEGYGVEMWQDSAQELLRAALKQGDDDAARREATILINRISARGAIDYASLLTNSRANTTNRTIERY